MPPDKPSLVCMLECWHLSAAVQGRQDMSMLRLCAYLTGVSCASSQSKLNFHPYRIQIRELSVRNKEVSLQFCHQFMVIILLHPVGLWNQGIRWPSTQEFANKFNKIIQ
jgi:hypothetical protein